MLPLRLPSLTDWQYGRTHPIPAQELRCVPAGSPPLLAGARASTVAEGTVSGHGWDDVGSFSTKGVFSGTRFALTKRAVARLTLAFAPPAPDLFAVD